MPVSVRRTLTRDIRIMHGYCEVFGAIRACLEENRAPVQQSIDQRIWYSLEYGEDKSNARLFLQKVDSRYALHYLLRTLRGSMVGRNLYKHLDEGLKFLPRCLNDTGYSMLEARLIGGFVTNSSSL
jgi:hypothetical protein